MAGRSRSESGRRVSDCVTALLRDQPFFGSLALRLPIRADTSRETLASDGRDIRFSPQWVARTDADLIKTAIGRVVLACALKHHTRRGDRDPERWQMASQLVTHGILRDAGFLLPPDAEAWDDISVEQAYDRLPEPPDSGTDQDGAPQSGDGEGGSGDSGDPSDPSGDGNPQGEDGAGACDGSESPSSFDPSGTGEVMDAGARCDDGGDTDDPFDTAAEEQAWDEAMHQAASLARAQGKAPGAIEEAIRDAHGSVLDWRALLRRYMVDAARRDYSWSFPNGRFIDQGLYLPSIRSEGIDTIAVIIDTSASLPAETLSMFWSEVREIAVELQPDSVLVLQVDAAVQDATEYSAGDLPERIALKGRGGTDFRPGFQWLAEHGHRPGCCLYLTDMECHSYPEIEPDFPVIWCDWGRGPGSGTASPGASASTSRRRESARRAAEPPSEESVMPHDIVSTGRAARILIERDPGPGDRLDAFLLLAGQEYLWRRRDGPGAEARRSARGRPASPRPSRSPSRRGQVAASRLARGPLYSPDCRGRASDTDWRPGASLSIGLGLPYETALKEPPRSLPHAERRVTELALANVVDPGVEGIAP